MSCNSDVQADFILKLAEAELGAFLRGMEASMSHGDLQVRGSAWISNLISRDWPEHNYPGFFRAVTILTIIQLVSNEQRLSSRKAGEGDVNEFEQSFISA